MKHLLLSVGLLMASASLASADVWTTTEPDGSQQRTVVRDPNEPARDYTNNNDRKFFPSKTTTITRGERIPDGVNQMRPNTGVTSSQLQVGTWVPSYPYYPYPYYQPPQTYYYPPTYTPLTPYAGVVTTGRYGPGYPYGYPAVPAYPSVPAYPYPYSQAPTWNFYGYSGPGIGGNSGYYNRSTNTTGGRVTIGGGGVRGSIGSSRTTTTGSYSTF